MRVDDRIGRMLFLLAVLAATAGGCAIVAPGGAEVAKVPEPAGTFRGHRYLWTQGAGNWEQVEQEAVRMGGHLVAIDSAEENQYLVQSFGDGPYWIGLVQTSRSPEPGGGWHWAGEAPLTFTNWHPGQPDNFTGHDDFGFLLEHSKGGWDDVPVEGWPPTSSYRGVVELPR